MKKGEQIIEMASSTIVTQAGHPVNAVKNMKLSMSSWCHPYVH